MNGPTGRLWTMMKIAFGGIRARTNVSYVDFADTSLCGARHQKAKGDGVAP